MHCYWNPLWHQRTHQKTTRKKVVFIRLGDYYHTQHAKGWTMTCKPKPSIPTWFYSQLCVSGQELSQCRPAVGQLQLDSIKIARDITASVRPVVWLTRLHTHGEFSSTQNTKWSMSSKGLQFAMFTPDSMIVTYHEIYTKHRKLHLVHQFTLLGCMINRLETPTLISDSSILVNRGIKD